MRTDVSRQHKILHLLNKHKSLTAKQLAAYLDVSTKTIYRDVLDLTLANFPIECSKGRHTGGIRLMEGYSVPFKIITAPQKELLAAALDKFRDEHNNIESVNEAVFCQMVERIIVINPMQLEFDFGCTKIAQEIF